ncbi:MAG: PEP/pyruvate-binding domain-containing protein, partial [Spirochaetota bacterium]
GMIKYVEDRGNVDADILSGMVRVILLIEDSIRYYSRYLPLLYTVVLKQTQALIEEERGVETYRLLRSRARPKILLAGSYEEAERLFATYENSILALITDLRFQHGGKLESDAGFSFVAMARARKPDLPVLIQSSEAAVRERAQSLGAIFAEKSSESLALELGDFLRKSLGFGPFRFLDGEGNVIALASTIEEFMARVSEVPGDCLLRHAERNQFSTWLTARGEYRFASLLRHYSIDDFSTSEELRSFILHVLDLVRREKSEGLVPDFDESVFRDALSMTRLGSGSVGGKGRGIEFLKSLAETEQLEMDFPGLSIRVPRTLFIGIDEFEDFLERNGLWSFAYYSGAPGEILGRFREASFSGAFCERVRRFLSVCHRPLALRSSGLLEDMVMLPFAGVYDTCFIPNADRNLDARLDEFLEGLRRVWASLFSARARRHFDVVGYFLEEERMAVIVQELVGHHEGANWQPRFSGVALSSLEGYRYPQGDSGACMAFVQGLGSAITSGGTGILVSLEEGGPTGLPPFLGGSASLGLVLGGAGSPVKSADLALLSSSREIQPSEERVRIFLRHSIPALKRILDLLAHSYGNEALLEFAYESTEDGGSPELLLLQSKPFYRPAGQEPADPGKSDPPAYFMGESLGFTGERWIEDLVLVHGFDPLDPVDLEKSTSVIAELRTLDRRIASTGRLYALVGKGRWGDGTGTTGLPVEFADVAHACLVVEGYDPSAGSVLPLGSHFFSNVLAAGASWLRVRIGADGHILDRDAVGSFTSISSNDHCQWLRSSKPLLWRSLGGRGGLFPRS